MAVMADRRHGDLRPRAPARAPVLSPDAHRDLERQLAQGPPRKRRVVARPRPARRAAHAGDQAHRPGSAADAVHGCAATRCSTTARAAGTASRSLTRLGASDVDHQLRRRPGPEQRRRRGRVAVAEEDFDPFDEARMVSAVGGGIRFVRSTRPTAASSTRRSMSASCAGTSGCALGRRSRDPGPSRWWSAATTTSPRPTPMSGMPRPSPRRHPRSPPERAAFGALLEQGLVDGYRRDQIATPGATRGGTTAPACSTRTTGCGSTTCC